MTKLTFSKLLSVMSVLLSLGIIASCDKTHEPTDNGMVVLESFGPTGAKHGDTLKFIGRNMNKVTSIQFTGTAGAMVEQKDFKEQTEEIIKLIVPQTAEKGFVTLKTPDGDIVSKTQFNLDVAVIVNSITAQARPGENVTINGKYLNWVTRVTFARDKLVTNFVSKTIDRLVVTIPADAETGPLILSYAGTDSGDVQTADTLKVTLPLVTGMTPNPIKHQTDLTITGTNLDLAKQVIFSGVSTPVTSFVSQSATQLVVRVPGETTKGKLTLAAASGVKTLSSNDLDVVMPAITNMAPNPVDPGANLTVTGTNLDLVTAIAFVGVTNPVTTFVSKTPTQIVVTVPTGVLKGKITLSVLNSTLKVQSANDLDITGGLPPLADFTAPIYTDAPATNFQDWSYTDTHDFNSNQIVRQGTKSIKAVYGGNGYQGITFHNVASGISTTGYTSLEFSVYADAASNGKKLQIVTNGAYGGSVPQVTLVGGSWTTFSVLLSAMGSPATITEIVLQGANFAGTVHIDHVGLR